MRFYLVLFLLLTTGKQLFAAKDSLHLKVTFGMETKELTDLMKFQGIEQIKLKLEAEGLKGKQVSLYFETYDSGKVVDKGNLSGGLPPNFYEAPSDSFNLKCLSQVSGDSVKINFYYPRFSTSTFFKLRNPVVSVPLFQDRCKVEIVT